MSENIFAGMEKDISEIDSKKEPKKETSLAPIDDALEEASDTATDYAQEVDRKVWFLNNGKLDYAFIVKVIKKGSSDDFFGGVEESSVLGRYAVVINGDKIGYLKAEMTSLDNGASVDVAMAKVSVRDLGLAASIETSMVRSIVESAGTLTSGTEDGEKYFDHIDNETIKNISKELFAAKTSIERKLEESSGMTNLSSFMKRYMFKKHILLRGERGAGKTYSVDRCLRGEGIRTAFIAGHEAMESADLLGYYIKDNTGNLVWLDGQLTEALRMAQTEKVALFFDELLRTPAKELNILVASLTPDSTGHYVFRTNRVVEVKDGVAKTETLRVPAENFWVVGTTNIGSQYNIEDMDHALSDRFRVFHKASELHEISSILGYWVGERGFSNNIRERLVSLYDAVKKLHIAGQTESFFNARHLSEAVQLAETENDVRSYVMDAIYNICSTDMNGEIEKTEYKLLSDAIKRTL